MSYILDALKKAESERRQGTETEPKAAYSLGQPRYDERLAQRRGRRLRMLGLGAVAAAAGAAIVLLAPRLSAPGAEQASANKVDMPVHAPPPVVATPTPSRQEPSPSVPADKAAAPDPATTTTMTAERAPATTADSDSSRPVLRHAMPPVKVAKAAPERPAPGRRAASEPELPTTALHDLPPDIRSRLPSLATSGFLYSGNAADRTVLLNGRLLHEGDEVAPGLTLEHLLPNGMVLNYEGHRFRSAY